MDFRKVKSVGKTHDRKKLPLQHGLVEVAIVGRSNVGKSTLLNYLVDNKKMAKTSATPGKTRAIHFYTIDDRILLVDLPGYGFAKSAKEDHARYSKATQKYFEGATDLRLLLLLLDIRRDPSVHDRQMVDWAEASEIPICAVLTKADKLGKTKIAGRKKEILSTLDLDVPCVATSASKRIGRADLIALIKGVL